MRAVTILAALALAGCGTTTAVKLTCLPLKTYTPQQQALFEAELAALPPGDPLVGLTGDYLAMRDADRACLGVKP